MNSRLALLAGRPAAALLAAVFASDQRVQSAAAQNNNQTETDSQPAVASIDDVKCTEGESMVHHVDNNVTTTSAF